MRSRSSTVLLALAVAACARPSAPAKPSVKLSAKPSVTPSGYAPKWHVGDWWLTKTLAVPPQGGGWAWRYKRYDVVRIEKVGKQDCFVLQTVSSGPKGEMERDTILFYVRVDDWLIVRQDVARFYSDKPIGTGIRHAPLGLFGPYPGEPALPRFPLRLDDPDTSFRLKKRDDGGAEMREISSIADPATVKRLLDKGDSASSRVLRPTGIVYQVRNELGGNLEPGPYRGERRIKQHDYAVNSS